MASSLTASFFSFPFPTANRSGAPTIVVEAKGFHAQDGAGISIARIAGIKSGLITRRNSETVALRARDLKLEQSIRAFATS